MAQTICDTANPCLSGGQCSSNASSPTQYTCDCGDWFQGINCEGIWYNYVILAADSKQLVRFLNDPHAKATQATR